MGEQDTADVVDNASLSRSMESIGAKIEEIIETTTMQNNEFQQRADAISDFDFLALEVRDRINNYRMVEQFRYRAEEIELP